MISDALTTEPSQMISTQITFIIFLIMGFKLAQGLEGLLHFLKTWVHRSIEDGFFQTFITELLIFHLFIIILFYNHLGIVDI